MAVKTPKEIIGLTRAVVHEAELGLLREEEPVTVLITLLVGLARIGVELAEAAEANR